MKRKYPDGRAKRLFCGLVIMIVIFGVKLPAAHASVANWQKGIDIYPHWTGDYDSASFRQSLDNLKKTGANYVGLVVPIYQAGTDTSDIYPGGDTPTDAALVSAIKYAHSIGLKVMLKPHLGLSGNGTWRAYINASNRDAWFTNYGNFLNHLGDLANPLGVEGITMGTELISMASYTSNADNTARWNTMIANLRQHFSGYLTYDANWSWGLNTPNFENEVGHIGFWPNLDYVSISAYYPVAENVNNPTVDQLVGSWQYWDQNQIVQIHNNFNKPILFTEVGYRSTNGAHNAPCCSPDNGYNGTEQANDYQALFQYWNNVGYLAGVFIWNWDTNPNYGGQGNTDYTPQMKPAEAILTSWYSNSSSQGTSGGSSGGSTGGGTTGGSASSGTYTTTAQIPNFIAGTSGNIAVNVRSSGGASNVIVDFEIYDSSNNKIFQKYFTGQNITANNDTMYNIAWTPGGNGNYTLKLGIFNQNWSTNYFWNNNLGSVIVGNTGGSGSTGGTASSKLDIWWPTDGSHISGVQPFKVLLENTALSNYSMYWQVDGGSLVSMNDSQTDYPHKESLVNVSNWNWRGSGPYKITFVAKDGSGNTITTSSVNVWVQ